MRRRLPVLGGILLTGCMHASPTTTGTDEADCLASGGRWAGVTMLLAACHWPTTDGGRLCTDDAQCQGLCVPGDDAYDPAGCSNDLGVTVCSERRHLRGTTGHAMRGVCASIRRNVLPANCKAHVVDGRLVVEACAD